MTVFETVGVYIAINILLLVYLAFRVVQGRRSTETSLGDGGHDNLTRAIRAHGNASEYIPGALAGLLAIALMDGQSWMIHAFGGSFTLARFMHAYGLTTTTRPARFYGTGLTWLSLLAIVGCLLWLAFT